jgi:hypothetical protein
MVFTNEVFVLAIVCGVCFVRGPTFRQRVAWTFGCCGLVAAVYLLFNPYVLLDFSAFLAEARHVKEWYGPGFKVASVAAFIQHPLLGSLGLPTALLALWGFITLARSHAAWTWIVAAIGSLYCLLLVHELGALAGSAKMARLMFALFPLLCVVAVSGLQGIPGPALRYGLAGAAIVWAALFSWPYARGFGADSTEQSTRLRAGRWINEHVPAGAALCVPPSPAPYKFPPIAFGRFRLITDEAEAADYRVTIGLPQADPGWLLEAEFRASRFDMPLSFASQPVFVYRRKAE